MSERYTKLFSLPENLYAEGAPVIVSAGNLLKDNQTGKVLAQLKIKNIAAKPLKAATVLIRPQDAAGKPMTGDTQQKYLDLTAKTGEEFGQKTAVFLPDASARGFSVEVTQAVFADNSTWEGTAAPWEPLPAPESLSSKLGDAELLTQFQLKFGGRCEAVPQDHKDLWLCACGAWNRGEKCCACGKSREALLSLDPDALKAERDARLAKEKAEREAKEAADKAAAEAKSKKTKKMLAITIPAAVTLLAVVLTLKVFIPNSKYKEAEGLFRAGKYEEAIAAFEALDGFKDSAERITAAETAKAEEERLAREAQIEAENAAAYAEAEAFLADGKTYEAALAFYQIKGYQDSWDRCFELWGRITKRETIVAGVSHSAAVLNDGRVVAKGWNKYSQCDVGRWGNIVAVAAGEAHTVGLQENGYVVAVGYNKSGACDVYEWSDIVSIAANGNHTIGLRADGTVVATGANRDGRCDVSEWTDIIAVSCGEEHTVGLKADGSVVAAGNNEYGQCDVSDWSNIIAISAGGSFSVGLKNDGTVVITQLPSSTTLLISDWVNISAVSAGRSHVVGLKSDGTVIVVGGYERARAVTDWNSIVAVSANLSSTIGLKEDGTVVATGNNQHGNLSLNDWSNIKLPN